MEPITIGKNNVEDYNGVKWVKKAMSKESTRWSTQYIHVDGKHIWATDGHRLHAHRLVLQAIPKGSYQLLCDKRFFTLIPVEAKQPMLLSVFPRHQKVKAHIKLGRGLAHNYTAFVRKMDESETVNIEYFEELTESEHGFLRYFGEGKPIWMKNFRRSGLVMPLRF